MGLPFGITRAKGGRMTNEVKELAKAMAKANMRAKYSVSTHYAWHDAQAIAEVYVSELSADDCVKALAKALDGFTAIQLLAASNLLRKGFYNENPIPLG